MQITNGTIEYEHPRKIADFQIPKAKVSLSFVIPEGEDPEQAIARVGDMARVRAMQMVGDNTPSPVVAAPSPPAIVITSRKRFVPPATPAESTAAPPPAVAASAPHTDPFGAPAGLASSAVAPIGGTPNPVIDAVDPRHTDKALQDACAAKCAAAPDGDARQRMTTAVKGVLAEFTGNPALKSSAISLDQRAEFLSRLAAL